MCVVTVLLCNGQLQYFPIILSQMLPLAICSLAHSICRSALGVGSRKAPYEYVYTPTKINAQNYPTKLTSPKYVKERMWTTFLLKNILGKNWLKLPLFRKGVAVWEEQEEFQGWVF